MEDLELEGCNGNVRKFRGFKKMTKVQNEKRHGSKCNFSKVGDRANLPWLTNLPPAPPITEFGGERLEERAR